MSRNVKASCQNLFRTIAQDSAISESSFQKLRVLEEIDPLVQAEQVEFISSARYLSSCLVLNTVKITSASYKNDDFLMLSGISADEFNLDILDELAAEGLFLEEIMGGSLILFSEIGGLERRKNLDNDFLIENILSQQEDSLYKGHSVNDLLTCLEEFCVFKVTQNSSLKDKSAIEIAYYLCSHLDKYIRLPFDTLLTSYKDLLRDSYKPFKDNIFLSLTSTHFKHAFLELYRCIEMLYAMPRGLKLKSAINFPKTAYELSKHCNKELQWKPNEQKSLIGIFDLLDVAIFINSDISKTSFASQAEWSFDDAIKEKNAVEKIAEKIYLIRNQLVHQFEIDSEITITQSDWIILISLLINIIKNSYAKFKTELP